MNVRLPGFQGVSWPDASEHFLTLMRRARVGGSCYTLQPLVIVAKKSFIFSANRVDMWPARDFPIHPVNLCLR
jgi:hypothetical protein